MLSELGIEKIYMPLPFRLNHVNCFLAKGESGYTIIDTGLHDQNAVRIWKEVLKGKEVEKIVLTHLHPDHMGYAGTLQNLTNAEGWMTKTDEKALQKVWTPESIQILKKDYEKAAMPVEIAENILKNSRKFPSSVTPFPQINYHLHEGQQLQLGNEIFDVIETPGHSAGLVCFHQPEKSVLFSTDHILPKITPNISYWFYGEANPLQSFQDSLEKVKKLDVEYVIPSHGEAFTNANKRIDEIWQHHEDRLEVVLNTTKNGATMFEVCQHMFNRTLSTYDYQFAIGEAIAHLEYLRAKNLLQRELVKGRWVYSHATN